MASPMFLTIIKLKKQIAFTFRFLYVLVICGSVLGVWALYRVNQVSNIAVDAGYTFGKIAIVLYILTLLPGIARRFKIQAEPLSFLSMYRRQLGILMYLFVFGHFWMLFGSTVLVSGFPLFPPQLQTVLGMIANYGLLAMAVTSNDIATKKLGIWWNRIHTLTYTITWFIFLHVVLVRLSLWSVVMGGTSLLVLASHLYANRLKKVSKL